MEGEQNMPKLHSQIKKIASGGFRGPGTGDQGKAADNVPLYTSFPCPLFRRAFIR